MSRSLYDHLPKANFLPVLMAINVLLLAIFTPLNMAMFVMTLRSSGDQPTLVQLQDGSTAWVTESNGLIRGVANIEQFTQATLYGLLDWNGVTLNEVGQVVRDEQKPYRSKLIPTSMYYARYGLSVEDGFRDQIITEFADWYEEGFGEGKKRQKLDIRHMDPPIAIKNKPGHWRVGIVASLRVQVRTKEGYQDLDPSNFNKEIYIKAIPQPPSLSDKDKGTPEQRGYNAIRQYGLTIYGMTDYRPREFE